MQQHQSAIIRGKEHLCSSSKPQPMRLIVSSIAWPITVLYMANLEDVLESENIHLMFVDRRRFHQLQLQLLLNLLLYLLCTRLRRKSVKICSQPGILPYPAEIEVHIRTETEQAGNYVPLLEMVSDNTAQTTSSLSQLPYSYHRRQTCDKKRDI